MATGPAASLFDALLGLSLGSGRPEAGNRFTLEGLALRSLDGGGWELYVARLEAAELKLQRSMSLPAPPLRSQPAPGPWSLGPLAAAEGTLRAEIVDAQLLFDADVTVPIRAGQVNFRDAAVEHVGPDSRMGVSRLGLYVDAPNGRSYLFQFSATPVDGVEYERRGALLGPWVTDRGSLRLQPFAESLLRQPRGGPGVGFTEQARQLFARTAVSGEVQLGDGRFAAPGVQADFAGQADGHNRVRLHSEAVGRGLTLEIPSLSLRSADLGPEASGMRCDGITGALSLGVAVEAGRLQLEVNVTQLKLTGLHLELHRARDARSGNTPGEKSPAR